jgi:hypothetical protein
VDGMKEHDVLLPVCTWTARMRGGA